MPDAKTFFQELGAAALLTRIPSKPTIVDGRHVRTEDERTPEWRKEVCDELALICDGLIVPDELVEEITSDIGFAPDFLSVGSRARLVEKIASMVQSAQMRTAAE